MNKTEAIVLHLQKYNDKACILHLLTREHGRVPCLVYGLASKKQGNMYAPLMHIEIEYTQPTGSAFATLKRASLLYVPQHLSLDLARQTIALFVSEILFKTYTQPLADEGLFVYLTEFLRYLDHTDEPANAHILFLLRYAQFLGIAPDIEADKELYVLPVNRIERQSLLTKLCRHYEVHLSDFTTPVSLAILREVFD